jgi:hypothetical protein
VSLVEIDQVNDIPFCDPGIAGYKYNDANNDGVKDVDELGIPGWTIYLDLNDNNALDGGEPTTTTDGTGFYSFTGLPTGYYTVREVNQPNWSQTFPGAGQDNEYADVLVQYNLQSGNDFLNHNNGGNDGGGGEGCEVNCGSISGTKFNDLDGNGAFDGSDGGISGFIIYVDLNNNGSLDDGEPSATTDGNGNYTITGVPSNIAPGHVVREIQKSGWIQTFPSDNNGAHIDVVVNNNAVTDIDFGNREDSRGGNGGSGGSGGSGGCAFPFCDNSSSGGGGGTGGGTPGFPQVLGETTTVPNNPIPSVLGATELPRTGTGLAIFLLPAIFGLPLLKKRKS